MGKINIPEVQMTRLVLFGPALSLLLTKSKGIVMVAGGWWQVAERTWKWVLV